MKLINCLLTLILISLAMTGCNLNSNTNTYDVMFEKQPLLIDDGVYVKGNRIGTVVSTETAAAPVGRLAISIDSPYRELMRTNTVFYVSSGRLNLATLGGYGEPLDKETKVLGFKSKGSLAWFKARYLLKNQAAAASKKAAKLHQRAAS